MNSIEPLSKEMLEKEMTPTASLSFALFLGVALSGFYFYDLLKRWNNIDEYLLQFDKKLEKICTIQDAQTDVIEEHEQRIREKKDYDESDEVQYDKYQAWKGEYFDEPRKVEISLSRKKETTLKENQDWIVWEGESNASVTARDYYLGNLNPDFQWEIREGDDYYILVAMESFVESWNSVILLEIFMTFPSQESLLEFTEQTSFNGNPTINLALKKCLEEKKLQWQRVLIHANEA
jgi:hypothetical protein